jgi:hypothetical protein
MAISATLSYKGRLIAGSGSAQVVLDTFQDEDIKVSNNTTEISDIGEIPGTFTQQISLPGTRKNNDFFEQYYDISVYTPDTFNTNQLVEARLDFDGIFIADGFIKLEKVNMFMGKYVDSYEVTLFGAISDFAVNSKLYTLNDLDSLSIYNHTASMSNITGSWTGSLFSGSVVYPIAEYGQKIFYSDNVGYGIDEPQGAMSVSDFKPSIKVKAVWDAIFTKLGYTYTGSFWQEEPHLDKLYLLLNREGKSLKFNDTDISNFGTGKLKVINNAGTLAYKNQPILIGNIIPFPANAVEYDTDGFFTASVRSKYTPFPSGSSLIRSSVSGEVQLVYSASLAAGVIPQFGVYFKNTTTNVSVTSSLLNLNNYLKQKLAGTTSTQNYYETVTTQFGLEGPSNVLFNSGSGSFEIGFTVSQIGAGTCNILVNPVASNDTSTFEIKQFKQSADNKIVDIPLNMPFNTNGIRLLDFIRGIQKKYNLIIYPSKTVPNQLVVDTFDSWYKKGVRTDFNQYINVDDKIDIAPIPLYKEVTFTDTQDSDFASTEYTRVYNKTYGENQLFYYDSPYATDSWTVDTVFAGAPLIEVQNSTYILSGSSAASSGGCRSYAVTWRGGFDGGNFVTWKTCGAPAGDPYTNSYSLKNNQTIYICTEYPIIDVPGYDMDIIEVGACDTGASSTSGSGAFSMNIPAYIADAQYNPTTVSPRLLYYNGLLDCPNFYIGGLDSGSNFSVASQSFYPYFDHYLAITGSLPDTFASSSLFSNELSAYDIIPANNLVTDYWATYLSLIYNPRTKLLTANGVIPFADYVGIELNDIAQFRGNYYHINAINNYNLSSGECEIKLLGPIIPDTISSLNEPIYDPCNFNFSASLELSLGKWEEINQKWEDINVTWEF